MDRPAKLSATEKSYLLQKLPSVALIGRRNVGKSTLFNALIGYNRAITQDEPGVTVDTFGEIVWKINEPYVLQDMPGLDLSENDELTERTRELALTKLKSNKLILLILEKGIRTEQDYQLLEVARRTELPIIGVINKVDDLNSDFDKTPYYEMGLADCLAISAKGRGNLRALNKEIETKLAASKGQGFNEIWQNKPEATDEDTQPIRLALVGRPNSGKSSILNRIIGYEKVVVSSVAGTTRDKTDTYFDFRLPDGTTQPLVILDTAGIRRKVKQAKGTEFYSFTRSKKAMQEADIVILVADAGDDDFLSRADKKLADDIYDLGKPLIVVLNKWDKKNLDAKDFQEFQANFESNYPRARDMVWMTTSAKSGKRIPQLVIQAVDLYNRAGRRFPTSELNRFLKEVLRSAPNQGGKTTFKLKYAVHHENYPVRIKMFVPKKAMYTGALERFVTRKIIDKMDWQGVPVLLEIVDRTDESKPNSNRD